ncbi:MAG: hypothetical protein ACRC5T_10375 [Cetobacterium sp.]
MKRNIFLMALLVSTVGFAQAEDTMNVTANVLETLTLRVDKDVEFGNIAKGSLNKEFGQYSVKGELGATVKVELGGYNTSTGELVMKGEDGINNMIASVESNSIQTIKLGTDGFVTGDDVVVYLNVADDAKVQKYSGGITLKARYE